MNAQTSDGRTLLHIAAKRNRMEIAELLLAKKDLRLPRLLKKLSRFDAIIIDDIGYVQQEKEEMEALFTLLAERYEQGSVMITSNLPFSE